MDFENMTATQLIAMQTAIRRQLKQAHAWCDTERPDWDSYFMQMAYVVSLRGVCARKKVGAVLVDENHQTLSTGYNGKATGLPNCLSYPCKGATLSQGQGLNKCEAIHAEMNALIRCRDITKVHKAYITCSPCINCIDVLLASGCKTVVFAEPYPDSEEAMLRWTRTGRQWQHWTSYPRTLTS